MDGLLEGVAFHARKGRPVVTGGHDDGVVQKPFLLEQIYHSPQLFVVVSHF